MRICLALLAICLAAARIVFVDASQTADERVTLPAAAGTVKYTLDVGGLPEAEAVLREFEKPSAWDQDPRVMCDVRRACGSSAAEQRSGDCRDPGDPAHGRPTVAWM